LTTSNMFSFWISTIKTCEKYFEYFLIIRIDG
jgi:hypothetical protein